MSASNSTSAPEQTEPKKRKKSADDVARSKSVDNIVPEPDWFEASDARDLLNSMPRKVRKGPAPKLLTRI